MARHHAAYALEQDLGRRVLRNDAPRTELQCLGDLRGVDPIREDDRPHPALRFRELTDRVDRRAPRRCKTEQQDVRLQLLYQRQGGCAVACLADDEVPRIHLEQPPETVAEDRVLACDYDANGGVLDCHAWHAVEGFHRVCWIVAVSQTSVNVSDPMRSYG
jgi:hypothetical protein